MEITPCNRRTFSKSDAVLTYSHDDGCFYVAEIPGARELSREYRDRVGDVPEKAQPDISLYAVQGGNITFKQLSAEHQKEFLAARQKEANSLLSAGAGKILNDAESRRFEEQHPGCVLDALCTERWKATDEQSLLARSRWCVLGRQDPDMHEIDRSSPRPVDETINAAAQVIASRR